MTTWTKEFNPGNISIWASDQLPWQLALPWQIGYPLTVWTLQPLSS